MSVSHVGEGSSAPTHSLWNDGNVGSQCIEVDFVGRNSVIVYRTFSNYASQQSESQ